MAVLRSVPPVPSVAFVPSVFPVPPAPPAPSPSSPLAPPFYDAQPTEVALWLGIYRVVASDSAISCDGTPDRATRVGNHAVSVWSQRTPVPEYLWPAVESHVAALWHSEYLRRAILFWDQCGLVSILAMEARPTDQTYGFRVSAGGGGRYTVTLPSRVVRLVIVEPPGATGPPVRGIEWLRASLDAAMYHGP